MPFRLLPWEYAIRNLFRRPMRTALTFVALSTVVLLVFVVVGFIRGLESTLKASGDPRTAIVFSIGMGENLEYSSIPMRSSELIAASVPGIQTRYGRKYVSPELYLGTLVETSETDPAMGLVRGVTRDVLSVRRTVQIDQGNWPGPGQVMVGRMVGTKLGLNRRLKVGDHVQLEGRNWEIAGVFSAGGGTFESEIWCRLDELQQAMKRQDLSLVALQLGTGGKFAELDLFCKQRLDLELQAKRETEYYAGLQRDYEPIRWLAWLVVFLVGAAGIFAGLNAMYGAILGRTAELAMLQTLGFVRSAVLISVIQEGVLLAMSASLLASFVAIVFINGLSVRFTMGAFALQVDNVSVLIGCGVGLLMGSVGSIPPAIRALGMPVASALRSI